MSGPTPNLGMPELTHGETNGEATYNQGMQILDFHAQPTVVNHAQDGEPVSPMEGSAYVIAANPWDGSLVNDIAHFYNGTWHFYTPGETTQRIGWKVISQVNLNTYYWSGTEWLIYVPVDLPAIAYAQAVGDGTTPAQAVTSTPVPIDGFVTAAPVKNVTADITSGVATFTIQTEAEGEYKVSPSASITATGNGVHTIKLLVDGALSNIGFTIDLSNSQTSGGSGSSNLVTPFLAAGSVLTFEIESTVSSTVTYLFLSVNVVRIDT